MLMLCGCGCTCGGSCDRGGGRHARPVGGGGGGHQEVVGVSGLWSFVPAGARPQAETDPGSGGKRPSDGAVMDPAAGSCATSATNGTWKPMPSLWVV